MPGSQLNTLCENWPDVANVAYHESGHAVAARMFGRQVIAITIDPTEKYLGTMWTLPGSGCTKTIRESMILISAGPKAECLFRNDLSFHHGHEDDRRQVLELAWKLVGRLGSMADAMRECQIAERRAETLIRLRWNDVETIAERLLVHFDTLRGVTEFNGDLELLDELEKKI